MYCGELKKRQAKMFVHGDLILSMKHSKESIRKIMFLKIIYLDT